MLPKSSLFPPPVPPWPSSIAPPSPQHHSDSPQNPSRTHLGSTALYFHTARGFPELPHSKGVPQYPQGRSQDAGGIWGGPEGLLGGSFCTSRGSSSPRGGGCTSTWSRSPNSCASTGLRYRSRSMAASGEAQGGQGDLRGKLGGSCRASRGPSPWMGSACPSS